MVCRTTSIGSAVTSFARLRSGLLDQQTLSTFHDLIREGRNGNAPTQADIDRLVDEHLHEVRQDATLTDARRRSIANRLEAARTQPMDARTYYAAQRMMSRAVLGRVALDT